MLTRRFLPVLGVTVAVAFAAAFGVARAGGSEPQAKPVAAGSVRLTPVAGSDARPVLTTVERAAGLPELRRARRQQDSSSSDGDSGSASPTTPTPDSTPDSTPDGSSRQAPAPQPSTPSPSTPSPSTPRPSTPSTPSTPRPSTPRPSNPPEEEIIP